MPGKIKVLQLIDSLNSGGAEMMAIQIANGLVEIGIESHLCATRLEGNLKNRMKSSVKYCYLNRMHLLDIKAIFKLQKYIKLNEITVIHAHSSSFFIASLMKLFFPKVQLFWHNHFGNSEQIGQSRVRFMKICLSNFNSIISVSDNLNSWAKKNFNQKTVYLPNFAEIKKDKKEEFILKGEKDKKILCVANFRVEKNHLLLINAFNAIEKIHKDWTLHLVGNISDQDYFAEIENLILKQKIKKKVFIYTSVNNISRCLEEGSIGVLSSNFEGLPIALLEYGLAKLPVVVTNVGECMLVVQNEKSGLVTPSNNVHLYAKSLKSMIENKELREAMGENLFNYVNANYSKENYLNKLLQIYRNGTF